MPVLDFSSLDANTKKQYLMLGTTTWMSFIFWSFLVEFVSVIYFLNLATLSINESISFLFVLFIPILLGLESLSIKIRRYESIFFASSMLSLLFYLQDDVYLRAMALTIGMMGIMLVIFLWFTLEENERDERVFSLMIGLILFLLIRLTTKTLNPVFRNKVGTLLSVFITIAVLGIQWSLYGSRKENEAFKGTNSDDDKLIKNSIGNLLKNDEKIPPFIPQKGEEWPFIAFSLGGILFITHWLFTSHGIIPRWNGLEPFPWGLLVIFSLVSGLLLVRSPFVKSGFWWMVGFVGAVLLAFGFGFTGLLGGLLMAVTLPALWSSTIYKIQPSNIGRTALISIFIYLFLLLGSVFTVTYAYIPGGEIFKENEELILLIASFIASFTFIREMSIVPEFTVKLPPQNRLNVLIFLVIFGLTGAAGVRMGIESLSSDVTPDTLTIMTWNIQQGFDANGLVNFEEIAQVMKNEGISIIGIQESDTVRVSSGNRDIVEWLSTELGMYSYYGPTPKESTFGNALLSFYPILEARSVILPSKGELAVLLVTKILIKNVKLNVLVAHFGETEEDRTAQAEATATIIRELEGPTFLIGDFNSEPGSTQISQIIATGLVDSYYYIHGDHAATTISSEKTIDFIFSSNVTVLDAMVLDTGTISDHQPVIVTFTI